MGALEVGIILLSLVVGAAVLGAAWLALARTRWSLSRVPRGLRPAMATGVMMAASVTVLLLFAARPPAEAGAAAETIEVEESEETREANLGKIRVFPFENWGDRARRLQIGEQFHRAILDELPGRGYWAVKAMEKDPPLNLHDVSRAKPRNLIAHYRKYAPLLCITGYVSEMKDGRFEVHVVLSHVDAAVRSKTLLDHKAVIRNSKVGIETATREAVEALADRLAAEAGGSA
jgi:hypothetical protein